MPPKTAKKSESKSSSKFSPFSCAKEMVENPVLWNERSPDFQKAYSQFMMNRLLSLDSQWILLLEQIISMRKFTDRLHHDCIVSFMAGKKWKFGWIDYQAFYPRNDERLTRAISLYYEIGSEDSKLAAARMDESQKKRIMVLAGVSKED